MQPTSKSEFSMYPNPTARRGIHIAYWIVLFFFILRILAYSFKTSTFHAINILFSVGILFNTILVHYFICLVVFRHVQRRKWLLLVADTLAVYLFGIIITTACLVILRKGYPGNEMVFRMYNNFAVTRWQKLFRSEQLIWTWSFLVWFNTSGILIRIIKDFHESSLEKMVMIQEKNAMEISFLRAQVQPHFLFNALNSIYGLVLENEEAGKMIIQLSNLLRFSLYDSAKDAITLQEETAFLTNYILLQKMRHKESRVQISYDFEQIGNSEATIKPLILVNFIENAFKHGINASIDHMWVKIALTESNGIATFIISNNKPLKKANTSEGKGLGLQNIYRRLELEYPGRYSFDIKETTEVYEVILVIKL